MTEFINVRVRQSDVDRIKGLLRNVKNGTPTAFRRTNNKSLDHTKAKAAKEISEEVSLKNRAIKRNLEAKRATQTDTTAILFAPQKGLLYAFYKFSPLARGGFSVKLFPNERPRKYNGGQYPRGYIIPKLRYTATPAGTPVIRKAVVTDPRKPSEWLYGPSYSQTYGVKVKDIMFRIDINQFQQRTLQFEVNNILRKA